MARRSFPAARGQKRKSNWVGPADQDIVAVASGASVIIASFEPDANAMQHPTLVRTRGDVQVRPQSFTADLAIGGAFGVCLVSDEAFAAGTASIPRPFDDADWGGWLVWQSFSYQLDFATEAAKLIPAGRFWQVDSKAMRKVPSGNTVVLMAESQTGAFAIAMHLRLLFLLL